MKKIIVVEKTKTLLPNLLVDKDNYDAGVVQGSLSVNGSLLDKLKIKFNNEVILGEPEITWTWKDRFRAKYRNDLYLVIHVRANYHPRPTMYGCEIVVDDNPGGTLITLASSINDKLKNLFRMRGGAKTRITGIKYNSEAFGETFRKIVPKNQTQKTMVINLFYSSNKKDVERFNENHEKIVEWIYDPLQIWMLGD